MEQQSQKIFDVLRMVRRRFWLISLVTIFGCVASIFIAFVLPPVYQSEAKILVEGQQIPDELARSTVTATASERLDKIQQRLMSRDNLERLIVDQKLYANRPDLATSQKIDMLRDAITIFPFVAPGSNFGPQQITAFSIRVTYNDAEKTASIVNALVSTVLDLNAQSRSEQASETLDFFKKREEELRGLLARVEAEMTAFKRENREILPDSLQFRRDEMNQIDEQSFDLDRRMLTLEEERSRLEAQIRQTEAAGTTRPETPAQQQLRQLRARLAELRTVYTENHREIQAVLAQIRALEKSEPQATEGADRALVQAEIDGYRARIADIERQIVLMRDQKKANSERRAELVASISRTPDIESQLIGLERQRRDLQDQLTAASQKRAEAETGEKLEINQQAERFSVIENAEVPEFPIKPRRKQVAAMGGILSLALAFGLALLIETLRPVIRTGAQMQRQLDLTPVISIPFVRTASERRRRRVRFASLFMVLCVGVPAGLYAVDRHVMPLQSVGEKVAEKTGLNNLVRTIKSRFPSE